MSETSKAVIFQAGNEEFALPIFNVISIEKMEEITPVPQMPDFVMGVVKVRDQLIPAIDSEAILYQRRLQPDYQTRMIVLDADGISFGVVVKAATEIMEIPAESIHRPELAAFHNIDYLKGIATLSDRMVIILDPGRMIESLEGIKEVKAAIEGGTR
jgi:purine-binding chemotaxis protein CheW